jgi:energy-coupling factor transport system permease protein
MLRDITLGQFFPGKTLIHNLDPRTKLIFTVVYIVALFICGGYASYALIFAILAFCVIISHIRLSVIMKGMKPLLIIIILTSVLNLFYTKGEPIVHFWIIKITYEGIRNTLFMILRIFLLITGTFLLTYTTSPMQLTDGMESLLSPLKKIKVPVHELSMMMSIALRFIPTLIEETDKIMSAQKARGADFETGGLLQKAKAMLPLLIPLFVSAFRRADELAVAMESRCYHGGAGRTKMKRLVMKSRDFLALMCGAALLMSTILLNSLGV